MPDGPEVVITTGTIAAGTAFNSILLTRCFLNCYDCSNNYITWCSR